MQSDTLDIIWNARFIISVKTFPVDLQLSAHAYNRHDIYHFGGFGYLM